MVRCLRTIGVALLNSGRVDQGISHLERCLTLAEDSHNDRAVGQTLANLGSGCGELLMLDRSEGYLRRGITCCAERDLDAPRLYQVAWLALVRLMRGQWDEASAAAHEAIADRRATTIARIMALIAHRRLRARRGDAGVWTALDEARDLAAGTGTLKRMAPMHAARAEAAWLEGRTGPTACEAAACLPLALAKRQAGFAAELLHWCRRGGVHTAIPAFCEQHPFALEATGRWQPAAQALQTLGCRFETRRLNRGDARTLHCGSA